MTRTNLDNASVAEKIPQLHRLNGVSREALGSTVNFYESICADYERVAWERTQQLDETEQRERQWLDWLGVIRDQLARMGFEKKPDETIVDTVARFIEHTVFEAGIAAGTYSAAREAYRNLCEGHNIVVPCQHFTNAEGVAVCMSCNHPEVVHSQTTEAAS